MIGVSEATRKALPTAAEMAKLKELYAAAKANPAKQGEVRQLQNTLHDRLANGATSGGDVDFFERCKADQQLRKLAQDNNDMLFGTQPLINDFSNLALASKNKEEFAARVVGFERFAAVEKTPDSFQVDNMIYTTTRSFCSNNTKLFPTWPSKVQFCEFLKEKGVKSGGLDRYRTYAARFR